MKLVSVDIGLTGGITVNDKPYQMPVKKIQTKPPVMVLNKDSKGKKQYYKSGPNKGEAMHKVKIPAKYTKKLDLQKIVSLFSEADTIIIESPGTSAGNSARSSRTTHTNYGKILACAELSGAEVVSVAPHKWKADLNLPADKLPTIELAEELSGISFRTKRGALLDGMADSYCIGHWYKKHILKEQNVTNPN